MLQDKSQVFYNRHTRRCLKKDGLPSKRCAKRGLSYYLEWTKISFSKVVVTLSKRKLISSLCLKRKARYILHQKSSTIVERKILIAQTTASLRHQTWTHRHHLFSSRSWQYLCSSSLYARLISRQMICSRCFCYRQSLSRIIKLWHQLYLEAICRDSWAFRHQCLFHPSKSRVELLLCPQLLSFSMASPKPQPRASDSSSMSITSNLAKLMKLKSSYLFILPCCPCSSLGSSARTCPKFNLIRVETRLSISLHRLLF